jgi:hypothetical protein
MSRLLLGGVTQSLLRVLNHAPHVADAFGAPGLGLAMTEYLGRAGGAPLDGDTGFPLADSIAVTEVHGPAGFLRD